MKEFIEKAFGIKDSELESWEYNIPEGYTASIKNGKIIVKKEESEDERIRRSIIEALQRYMPTDELLKEQEMVAWLEKQGESKFEQCIQEGDKIVTNEDGTHFNISQLERAAKKEPKFKVGDWVVASYDNVNQVVSVDKDGDGFTLDDGTYFSGSWCDMYHLWTIQDAKDGDVLAVEDKNFATPFVAIYKSLGDTVYKGLRDNITFNSRCFIGFNGNFYTGEEGHAIEDIHPATKEQRDILFQKMKEAGYEWDAEKKELKIIDWSKHVKYEPIDPSIIEEKSVWTEEDEIFVHGLIRGLSAKRDIHGHITFGSDYLDITETIDWLRSLKERMKGGQL